MSSAISQLSSFPALNRNLQLHRRSLPSPSLRSKLVFAMNLEGSSAEASTSESRANLCYTTDTDTSTSHLGGTMKSHPMMEAPVSKKIEMSEPVHEDNVIQQKKGARIHDFCFGIPYGGVIISGGLVGFIFSRNLATLGTSVLFGGALLALSTFSLKIWRQGKSSVPFILGQAVLAAALLWKNLQTYSLTKKLLPAGFYMVVSAAMLFFYSYVVISGGNPPPKKKLTATA